MHLQERAEPTGGTLAGAVAMLTALSSVSSFASDARAADDEGAPTLGMSSYSSPDATTQTGAPRRASALHADAMATTLVPLSLGPELSIELPGRVLAQAHLGWMPALYESAISGALEDAGVYDDTVGALVDGAFRGASTWRFGIGWRPFPNSGLELGAGYVRLSMDGATTTGEVMRLVPPELAEQIAEQTGNVGLALDSTIHQVMVGAGWRWLIAERVVVRASLSYLQAFDSRSQLDIGSSPQLSRLAEPFVNGVIHDHYMRYVKIPVVGIGIGYRFF